ncbi:hypothetical protein P7C73_g5820, partial [Tremellales sp. Uapishka_1]
MSTSTHQPPSTSSVFTAPTWITDLYSNFPLVVLDQEDEVGWRETQGDERPVLRIQPPTTSEHPHYRSWASPSPTCLRTQLLMLLRDPPVPITFRDWSNEASAPGGTLPALHLPKENRVVKTDEIRAWLDTTHPLAAAEKEFSGMPDQASYDKALAVAQLVLGRLYPAYLASLPNQPTNLHLFLPTPPPLAAGLTTPLPASLTGDGRDIDRDALIAAGVDALEALEIVASNESSKWILRANHPTPLDALIASHVYATYSLAPHSSLRLALELAPRIQDHLDRVMEAAASGI